MILGRASAIGLVIDIPMIIRSLAKKLSHTDFLSINLISDLLSAIYTGIDNSISTRVVESYSFNWWDIDRVR